MQRRHRISRRRRCLHVREFRTAGAALAYLRQFSRLAIGPDLSDLVGAAHKAAGRNKEKHRQATLAVRSLQAHGFDVDRPAVFGGGA